MLRTPSGRRVRLRRIGAVVAATLALGMSVQQGPTAVASQISAPHGSKAITPAHGTKVTKRFFGMHAPRLGTSFPDAPVGAVNLTTNDVYWHQVETSPGVYDFQTLDPLVANARSNGARPLLILGGTPTFHPAPGTTYAGVASVPDMAAWKAYVRAVVERYGRALDYEIWPEPNVKNNWLGTPDELAALVASASRIIHRRVPGSIVVAPAMVLRLRYERVFMKEFFATEVNGVPVRRFIDAVAIDPYPRLAGAPEDALALIRQSQHILAADRVTAPVWTAEINYGVDIGAPPVDQHSSDRHQVSYVMRTYLLSAGAGVKRVYWLGWAQFSMLDIALVDPDQVTPSAAGRAYALVAQWLTGQRARGCFHNARRDLYSCAFVRNGRTSWAYWTGSGTARVTAPHGARHVQKATGEKSRTRRGQHIRVTTVPRWVTH